VIKFIINLNTNKVKLFTQLLVLNFVSGILTWFFIVRTFEKFKLFNPLIEHPFNGEVLELFFSAVFLVPLIEELIFRYHLRFYQQESIKRVMVILSSVAFGFIHIFNYEYDLTHIYFSLIITLPQIISGFVLAFARLNLGFWIAVILHATTNLLYIFFDEYVISF
jgi:hypothetical protein